jgi:hypothetical protein
LPRFALRFWPDTRRFIRHLIAFGPSNHGTLAADTACSISPCAPALQQQRLYSDFVCALNSYQETFPGISYTNVLTRWDEMILPTASSELIHTKKVKNVYIQDWCPMRLFSEHLAVGTYDYCAYVIAISALQSKPLHNITNCCEQTLMPGITTGITEFLRNFLHIVSENARVVLEYAHKVTDEPELRCVFRTDCVISLRKTKVNKRR